MTTRRPDLPPARSRRRGGILVTIIIFSAVILLLAGGILRLSLTERKLTIRNALVLESRNAAEAVAEYGFSQIRQKFETRSTFSLDPDGSDALALPAAGFWTGGNIGTSTGDLEVIGGTVAVRSTGSGGYYYVDPANPNNRNDPLRGKWVWRRDVSVIARATVRHASGGAIVSHARQTISVRGAPLFAHAIFYNMDMEIAPGPDMHIYGPVHANGDLYLAHQSSNGSLNFHSQVTASGHLYHAWKYGVGGSHGNESLQNGHVKFINSAGELVSIRQNATSGGYLWNDSRLGGTSVSSDFRSFASSTWNGNLLTAAHGITDYKPVAVGEYREANPTNPAVASKDSSKAPSNSGRLLIEPGNYPADTTAADYATRMEIEKQKYANDAGIHIKIVPPATVGGTPVITVSSRSKSDPSKNKTLVLPATNPIVKYGAYKATATYTSAVTTKTPQTKVEVGSKRTSNPNKDKYPVTPTTSTLNQTTTTTYTRTIGSAGYSDAVTGTSTGGTTTTGSTPGNTVYMTASELAAAGYTANSTKTTLGTPTETTPTVSTPSAPAIAADNAGLYDRRRLKGVDLVDIDMDALRKAVAVMAGTSAKLSTGSTVTPLATDGIANLSASDWTGIVYVEIAGGPSTNPTTGADVAATGTGSTTTAVRILKGQGKVPSYGTANEGLTLATNAPMYVQGNYNADGSTSTATATNSARVPETGEVPAALVADAITLLSPNFNLATTLSTSKPTASGSVEVAAALLMGISPTNPTLGSKGESSGGVHNFPRFLENWDGKAVFIRGSLVALFESRVAVEPWSTDYYAPPSRNWGFNDLFAAGRYPPGTPRVMSYRRVDFEHLDAAAYAAARAEFGWDETEP